MDASNFENYWQMEKEKGDLQEFFAELKSNFWGKWHTEERRCNKIFIKVKLRKKKNVKYHHIF